MKQKNTRVGSGYKDSSSSWASKMSIAIPEFQHGALRGRRRSNLEVQPVPKDRRSFGSRSWAVGHFFPLLETEGGGGVTRAYIPCFPMFDVIFLEGIYTNMATVKSTQKTGRVLNSFFFKKNNANNMYMYLFFL